MRLLAGGMRQLAGSILHAPKPGHAAYRMPKKKRCYVCVRVLCTALHTHTHTLTHTHTHTHTQTRRDTPECVLAWHFFCLAAFVFVAPLFVFTKKDTPECALAWRHPRPPMPLYI